ncbi:MAG: hypothetical protein ACI9U2_003557 [Bradymonadia bacterium]|jgi:hypothetical protein
MRCCMMLVLVLGCAPDLSDLDGTQCSGAIPAKLRFVDYENEHPLPCSASEASVRERAANADSFRENSRGVLCLFEESIISCAELTDDEGTYYRCETDHPSAPPDLEFLPLVSIVNRGDDCPP